MVDDHYRELLHEISGLHKRQNMMLLLICAMILWLTSLSFASDTQDALLDRMANVPQENWPFCYYFGVGHLPADQHKETLQVLAFTVASTNRNSVIEQQLPVQISPTLVRIDTRFLGWQHSLRRILLEHYPYHYSAPLVTRADWFVAAALDQADGIDIYHTLLFGKRLAKIDEFHKLIGSQLDSQYTHGWIEDKSGVSVSRTRLLTTVPTTGRTDVWISFDSEIINTDSDPLEHLDGAFKSDASEFIYLLPKNSSTTTGHLQAYALATADGVVQVKAPASIVVDHTNVRGVEIRSALSCIVCHVEGLRPPASDALRKYIESGAEVYADYQQQIKIESKLLTNLEKNIARANEDYSATILAINGLSSLDNASALKRVVRAYDRDLTLAQAASELWISTEKLVNLLATSTGLPARLAQLAHDRPVPRVAWEEHYLILEDLCR